MLQMGDSCLNYDWKHIWGLNLSYLLFSWVFNNNLQIMLFSRKKIPGWEIWIQKSGRKEKLKFYRLLMLENNFIIVHKEKWFTHSELWKNQKTSNDLNEKNWETTSKQCLKKRNWSLLNDLLDFGNFFKIRSEKKNNSKNWRWW